MLITSVLSINFETFKTENLNQANQYIYIKSFFVAEVVI